MSSTKQLHTRYRPVEAPKVELGKKHSNHPPAAPPIPVVPEILDACRAGNLEKVTTLLGSKPHLISVACEHGGTALHWAATRCSNAAAIMEALLARGIAICAPDRDGATPLHWAATHGNGDTARFLLGRGALLTAKDNKGATPLQRAADSGNMTVAEALLRHGCSEQTKSVEIVPGRQNVIEMASQDSARLDGEATGGRDNKSLAENTEISGDCDVVDLLDGSRRSLQLVAAQYKTIIPNATPQLMGALVLAMKTYGNEDMAEAYLNSENPLLEDAARDWAVSNGFAIFDTPDEENLARVA